MKYKLVISDFDGTLGKAPHNTIDEYTIDKIREFEKRGGIFVICTGRMTSSILPICRSYGLKGLVITYQGAMISDIETGQLLLSAGVNCADAVEVIATMKKMGIQTQIYLDDVLYFDVYNEYSKRYEYASKIKGVVVDDVIELIKQENKSSLKICGMTDPERGDRAIKELSKLYPNLIFNKGDKYLVEVIDPRYSKGKAVEFLASYYNLPYSEIIAVGDSTNDIPLLNGEWYGVAVGDGSEELKKVAKEVTLPFEQNPVGYLIDKYCLKD